MIVLAPERRLSEAEVQQALLPIPPPRVRGPKQLFQPSGKQPAYVAAAIAVR